MIDGKTMLGLLMGFLATAAWGSFYIAGRWLFGEEGDSLNSWLFNFLRFAMAAGALSPLLLHRRSRELIRQAFRENLKDFLLISAVGIVMESCLVFCALKFTTAARCSLMANCSPIATVILARFMLGEKMPRAGLLGMCIGFLGIILAGLTRGGDIYAQTSLRSLIGDGMALASGFCWAFFTVKGANVSRKYGGPVCMFVCFALGTLIMLPCLIFTVSLEDFRATANPRIWYGILYTGIVTLALANAFWYGALHYLKASVLGAFGYLSAAITFTLSALVLKERFTPLFIASIVLIVGGMALMVHRNARAERKEPDARAGEQAAD